MISLTEFNMSESTANITWLNLVLLIVTPAKENCASSRTNHNEGYVFQNGGGLMETHATSAKTGLPVSPECTI